jgi:hypothetical protein
MNLRFYSQNYNCPSKKKSEPEDALGELAVEPAPVTGLPQEVQKFAVPESFAPQLGQKAKAELPPPAAAPSPGLLL